MHNAACNGTGRYFRSPPPRKARAGGWFRAPRLVGVRWEATAEPVAKPQLSVVSVAVWGRVFEIMYCKRLRTAARGQPGRGRAAGAPAEAARGPRGRQLLRLVNDWPMNRHDYEINLNADILPFCESFRTRPSMLAQDVVTAPIRVALPRWCREAGQCSITKGKDKFTVSFLCPCRGSSAAEIKPRKRA